jgi:hypothetical protein
MTIHYATKVKAEKAGVTLSEWGEPSKGIIEAFNPKHNVRAYGIGAAAAFEQVVALMRIKQHDDTRIIVPDQGDVFTVEVFNADRTLTPMRGYAVPLDVYNEISRLSNANKPWLSTVVPEDGGEAFKQGFTAADNPFRSDNTEDTEDADADEADAWDAEFDAAIEADEGDDEDAGGSVVKPEYRIRYAEAGHPTHCGDWLAVTLNNLILGKTQTDLEHFEELCNLNGVSLAKYNRSTPGWQGRLRMTGRNLLAGVVFSTGSLKVPASITDNHKEQALKAPGDWLSAQKFKTKKQATVLAEGRAAKVEPVEVGTPSVPVSEQMARRKAASKNKK